MPQAVWYFDFISPFAYLQLRDMGRLPEGLNIVRRPVLFAGLLNHWGHKGPAEIPAKRRHTYRYCQWVARKRNIPFTMPPAHPFNPLQVLRLAIATDANDLAINKIFDFIYAEGGDVASKAGWRELTERLGVMPDDTRITAPEHKQKLRDNTDEAIAAGVFGVPTFVAEGELFWGQDAMDMFIDWLNNPESFASDEFSRVEKLPVGARRRYSGLETPSR